MQENYKVARDRAGGFPEDRLFFLLTNLFAFHPLLVPLVQI
jgi:hypothetical protein